MRFAHRTRNKLLARVGGVKVAMEIVRYILLALLLVSIGATFITFTIFGFWHLKLIFLLQRVMGAGFWSPTWSNKFTDAIASDSTLQKIDSHRIRWFKFAIFSFVSIGIFTGALLLIA